MSLKPGDEIDKDQESEIQKSADVVDSEEDEVGNVNIVLQLMCVINDQLNNHFRMTPKLKTLKTIKELVER